MKSEFNGRTACATWRDNGRMYFSIDAASHGIKTRKDAVETARAMATGHLWPQFTPIATHRTRYGSREIVLVIGQEP